MTVQSLFSRAPIFNILLGFFPIFNIFQAPFLNISIFFLVFTNLTIISVVYTIEIRFKKSLGPGEEGARPHRVTGQPMRMPRGRPVSLLVALRGSSPRCRRSWPGLALESDNIQYFCGPRAQYSIFLWTLDSIFNIPI